ncbi:hypothetical protein PV708_04820 [Streptomyces sp. ME02-6977A]|uniref:hypothetical protein n=1 Tax=Streptomyces sp. ME02-6977A TaxID=3028671 RepID=UPI0029BD6501|nr:hypothetical protein [Streptomyces sp. ME02-6977A]MDX3405548.1 hypothetical protein [Streptomyces sp. ME02-6977A]
MTAKRYTASSITDDALDALYGNASKGWRRGDRWKKRALAAEAAVERALRIHTRGRRTNTCNDCGQEWPCEAARALSTEETSTK